MSATTSIEWTDRTWNPVRGCSVISPGCVNCYAMKMAHRFSKPGAPYDGLTKQTKAGPQWTGVIRTVDAALLEPLSWRKPQRVFVNSMSDLFHEDVPDAFIDQVFAVMALCPQHTFQVLTKRADRMRRCMDTFTLVDDRVEQAADWIREQIGISAPNGYETSVRFKAAARALSQFRWPLPNVWLGVSVEDRNHLHRIDDLKDTPAAVHFVSMEPLLEDLGALILDGIDWVIVGGESGPGSRAFNVEWAREIVEQCRAANIPVFVKQLGANAYQSPEHDGATGYVLDLRDRKGGDMDEWPDDLRVRQFPVRALTRET